MSVLTEIAQAVVTSITTEKTRHLAAIGTTAVGTAEATGGPGVIVEKLSFIPYWLPLGEIAAIIGIAASCMIIRKTMVEIKRNNIELEKSRIELEIQKINLDSMKK